MNNNSQDVKNNNSILKIFLPKDIKEKLSERASKNCRKPSHEALFIIAECLTKQEKGKEELKLFINEIFKRKRQYNQAKKVKKT